MEPRCEIVSEVAVSGTARVCSCAGGGYALFINGKYANWGEALYGEFNSLAIQYGAHTPAR